MEFYEILSEIMIEKDMSIPDVARACGLVDGTVRSMLVRKAKNVSLDVAFKLSNGLNVSLERLSGIAPNTTNKKSAPSLSNEALSIAHKYNDLDKHGKEIVEVVLDKETERMRELEKSGKADLIKPDTRVIRLYRTPAAAGAGNAISGEDYDDIVVSADQKGDFAVRISGDSMEPYIKDGGVAFVDESGRHNIKEGDVGIFEYDGSYYCKQLHKEYAGAMLYSVNRNRADLDVFVNTHGNLTFSCKGRVILPSKIPLPIGARI